jgi:hypothetical protein
MALSTLLSKYINNVLNMIFFSVKSDSAGVCALITSRLLQQQAKLHSHNGQRFLNQKLPSRCSRPTATSDLYALPDGTVSHPLYYLLSRKDIKKSSPVLLLGFLMATLLINFRFSAYCRVRLKHFLLCELHNEAQHFAYNKCIFIIMHV